jgi:glycogen operon protein
MRSFPRPRGVSFVSPGRTWSARALAVWLALGVGLASACAPVESDEQTSAPVLNRLNLGARFDASGNNVSFRVWSGAATRVELWLYAQPFGVPEAMRVTLTRDTTTSVWSTTLTTAAIRAAGVSGAIYYGYRAWGPNWPYAATWTPGTSVGFVADVDAAGNRFNPNKLLFDPYARELSHDPLNPQHTDGTLFASGPLYRALDSGLRAPKGIVVPNGGNSVGTRPTRALRNEIVYEVHVRGLTMNDPSVPAAYRGTYRGAGLVAARLQALGVTAIELLPLQETDNDDNDVAPTTTTDDNYWGYMTLGYFAPDRRYAFDRSPGGPTREFQDMVRAFHDRGIKVYVDVVYNHTGEGGAWSANDPNTYSVMTFRGLDNAAYYSLTADRQYSWDNTGVGGNFNTRAQVPQDLIVDSLAYWRDTMGVDGFRFDLASVLGNTCQHGCFNFDRADAGNAINRISAELPVRPANGGVGIDLIAEPWAIGGNSYQVGGFPAGWAEWNGQFRDVIRRDQNQLGIASITPGLLASRLAGSSDLYGDDGRRPWHSINFVTAHDGLTHRDLYACNGSNNAQAWPWGPSDGGTSDNMSWDQGNVASDQRKAARNGMALLLLSAGVPMLNGGDEFLRTVRCNNNPYNLDSSGNWLDYALSSVQSTFQTFFTRLAAFRNAHPALRPANFYSAVDTNGNVMEQLRWFRPNGQVPDAAYWNDPNSHALAWRIDGTEFGDPAAAIYVAYNGWSGTVNFTLPWPGANRQWYRVTDTCTWAEGANQVRLPGAEDLLGGEWTSYGLCGRGVLLLIAR